MKPILVAEVHTGHMQPQKSLHKATNTLCISHKHCWISRHRQKYFLNCGYKRV